MSEHIVREHTLERPIEYAGQQVTILRFREPTGKVVRIMEEAAGRKKGGQTFPLLAYFTKIDAAALETMLIRDTQAAVELMGEILKEAGLDIPDDEDGEGKD